MLRRSQRIDHHRSNAAPTTIAATKKECSLSSNKHRTTIQVGKPVCSVKLGGNPKDRFTRGAGDGGGCTRQCDPSPLLCVYPNFDRHTADNADFHGTINDSSSSPFHHHQPLSSASSSSPSSSPHQLHTENRRNRCRSLPNLPSTATSTDSDSSAPPPSASHQTATTNIGNNSQATLSNQHPLPPSSISHLSLPNIMMLSTEAEAFDFSSQREVDMIQSQAYELQSVLEDTLRDAQTLVSDAQAMVHDDVVDEHERLASMLESVRSSVNDYSAQLENIEQGTSTVQTDARAIIDQVLSFCDAIDQTLEQVNAYL
ncbi:hypothetical protein H4219_003743 [Mycoemilia scoparia]|uniref:Uncharacterized protein n=1 Tax=Mycoemilia scoparia TaxID=417184 RepID=A0A9W7ZZN1_9FUNG|nr:hypothetical protein H4219_003743 [Mycoemilia scoparia]